MWPPKKPTPIRRTAVSEYPVGTSTLSSSDTVTQPFVDPDPFHELAFSRALDAKRVIADHLALPLAKLAPEQLAALNTLLEETLAKPRVWDHVRRYLEPFYRRSQEPTMLSGVMEHFGLSKSLNPVAYYDSEYHQQVFKDLKAAIHDGGIVAFTGIVGSGKTWLLSRMQRH